MLVRDECERMKDRKEREESERKNKKERESNHCASVTAKEFLILLPNVRTFCCPWPVPDLVL